MGSAPSTKPPTTKPAKNNRPPPRSTKPRMNRVRRPMVCLENPSSATDCNSCMQDVRHYMVCLRKVSERLCQGKSKVCRAKKIAAKRKLNRMPTKERNMANLMSFLRSKYPGSYDSWKRSQASRPKMPSRFQRGRSKTRSPSKKMIVGRKSPKRPIRRKSPIRRKKPKLTTKQRNILKVKAMMAKQRG